jgi:hypothetical protein
MLAVAMHNGSFPKGTTARRELSDVRLPRHWSLQVRFERGLSPTAARERTQSALDVTSTQSGLD